MTVAELIELLEGMDQDSQVAMNGEWAESVYMDDGVCWITEEGNIN